MKNFIAIGLAVTLNTCFAKAAEYFPVRLLSLTTNGAAFPTAINDQGVIVGYSQRDNNPIHAFRFKPGGPIEDLGSINSPSFASFAAAISNDGQITGHSATRVEGFASGILFSDALGLINLPELPGGGDSFGHGVTPTGKSSAGAIVLPVAAAPIAWTIPDSLSFGIIILSRFLWAPCLTADTAMPLP